MWTLWVLIVLKCVEICANTNFYEGWRNTEYCMDEEKMQDVKIDTFENEEQYELIQAQVIARHGARAPYYRVFCWNAAASPVESTWNCSTSSVWVCFYIIYCEDRNILKILLSVSRCLEKTTRIWKTLSETIY